MEKKNRKKNSFRIDMLLLVLGVTLLIFAAIYGGYYYMVNNESEQTFATLRDMVRETGKAEDGDGNAKEYQSPYLRVFVLNEHMVAWIKIPDTPIDYPVMQTKEDEEYYLHRDFYGNENINGTLFAAAACNIEKPSTNILIHGHNMRSGQMFGELDRYVDYEFEKEHAKIYLYTKTEKRTYQIIAAFNQRVLKEGEEGFRYYQFFQAHNEEEFNEYVDQVKKLSYYNIEENAEYGDELITLSTCANRGGSRRFVVVGKRIS